MKKVYISIAALLLCSTIMMGQTQRTASTTVADVLAQMPAKQQAAYNKLVNDLSGTGEEGVMMLIKMINAPGKGSNAQVDYALNGLSFYVMAPGNENARLTTAQAYCKALDMVTDGETKAFIIRQLQVIGKDESVDALQKYLSNEELCGPAARALASIDSDKSDNALLAALNGSGDACKKNIVRAIADSDVKGSEESLLALVNAADTNLQKEVLYALSRCGSKASARTLATSAEKAGYTMEPTGANEAYITLIKRMLEQGDVKDAEKEATTLMNKARKAGKVQTRDAALEILLSIKKNDGLKLVLSALDDSNKEYRNAALSYASAFADLDTYKEIIKKMLKAKPEVKVDILNWIGTQAADPKVRELLLNNELKLNVPYMLVLQQQVDDKNNDVKEAAAWMLVKIKDKNSIPVLIKLLASEDQEVVDLGKATLSSFSGDIAPAVAHAIPSLGDKGKIAGAQLLALRKSDANVIRVYELIASKDKDVRNAALLALKDVVSAKELTRLFGMLQQEEAAAVPAIQNAIIAAMASQSKAEQVQTIIDQMYRAGNDKDYLFYALLANTGEQKALDKIFSGFTAGSGKVKEAAFGALLNFKGKGAAEKLFAICQDASASAYFDRALSTYVKMIAQSGMTGENRLIFLRNAMEIAKTDEQKIAILKQIERTDTFLGLIYAGEFIENSALQQAAAMAVMNIALNNKSYTGSDVTRLLNRVAEVLNNPDADYQRNGIRKHLSEMPKEDGYISLFNGKDLTGWKGLVQNPIARGKMTPAQLAKAQESADAVARNGWEVQDGMLVFKGKGDNLCTDKLYGDFEMYVDWKLDPAGPEADAGIYLRGTPQVQIWDTSRVKVGAQVGSGGLYNNQKNPSKPLKVADNKLGEWNSFYIKMIGDRVTVYLNGELVTDNVILENYWDRKQPIFPVEQLELQAHGSKVYYRDVYVKELKRAEPFELSAEEKKEGFKTLFDGTNMHAWTGNTKDYVMEDGCIVMYPSRGFGGNLYTKDEYKDFVYRFEFQLTPGANNGLGIRTPMEGDAAYMGMELQILDNEAPVYKDLHVYQYHGSVYGIIPSKRGFLKPIGEWNYQEVIAKGNRITVILNGEVILDGDIKEATKNGTPDKKEHPGLFNEKGHIGFLGHGSEVKFRNIRIKELK